MNLPSQAGANDVVELRVPAEPSYVSIVRLAAAGLAARCDLTVDDIEDLRLAVDEACALLLPHVVDDTPLEVQFRTSPGCVEVQASVATRDAGEVNRTGFAWTVLEALAGTVEVRSSDGRMSVVLTKRSEASRA